MGWRAILLLASLGYGAPFVLPSARSKPGSSRPYTLTKHWVGEDAAVYATQQVPFFDREHETTELLQLLKLPPSGILVISGPTSSGKTRWLEHVLYNTTARMLPPIHIDGRNLSITSPDILQTALGIAGAAWLSSPSTRQRLVGWSDMLSDVLDAVGGEVSLLLGVFSRMIEAACREEPTELPVILIDEGSAGFLDQALCPRSLNLANMLMKWPETSRADLEQLLCFFVKVTKQRPIAHVILCTSESDFISWLSRDVNSHNVKTHVIGDFAPQEARAFAQMLLLRWCELTGQESLWMTDDEWVTVYGVCGGNALSLIQVSQTWVNGLEQEGIGRKESLEGALKELWVPVYIKLGMALYESQAFVQVAQWLVSSDFGAISYLATSAMLSKLGMEQTVEELVDRNLLSVRPSSAWARDLPPEAFVDGHVIMATSATDYFCLKMLVNKEGVDDWCM